MASFFVSFCLRVVYAFRLRKQSVQKTDLI